MKNRFIDHDFFKKRLCKSQLFVMCCALVCIVLILYVYKSNSHLTYQQDQDFLPLANFRDDDTASKLDKVHNEAKQIVKLPDKPDVMNKNKISSQKDNNQQKANGKPDQLNVPGMNATHINGILMEPVNVNYARNIYFTIKTTHKNYAKRLFPLMLTWLQVVDKNKVSCYYNTHHIGTLYRSYVCTTLPILENTVCYKPVQCPDLVSYVGIPCHQRVCYGQVQHNYVSLAI